MPTVIDELIVRLGLDPAGFKRGRADQKAALDQMRDEVAQTQTAIDAIQAKAARQKRQHAAEERAIAQQIAQLNKTTVDATSADHNRQVKELRSRLTEKRAANRQAQQITQDEIAQQRKILATKQQSYKETEAKERDQSYQARKRIQQTREEGTAVQALTTKVIGLFAAFTAGEGIASFLKNTFEGAAAAGRLADNLGVDIEALGAWEGAVKRVGGAAADADGALASLVKTRELIRAGQLPGDQARVLNSFGVTAQDLNDPLGVLTKLADRAHTMSKAQFSLRLGMLGFDQNAINALENGGEALRKLMDEARRAGVPTANMSKAAQELQERWGNLKATSTTLGRDLLEKLAPSLEKIVGWLQKLADWAKAHPEVVANGIKIVAVALGVLGAVTLAPIIAGLVETAIAAAPLIGIFWGISQAVEWLTDDFDKFEKTGKSAIDWGRFIPIWESLKNAVQKVADAAAQVAQAFMDIGAAMPDGSAQAFTNTLSILGAVLETVILVALKELTSALTGIGDLLKLVADILKGDWASAWSDAGRAVMDFVGLVTNPLQGIVDMLKSIGDIVFPNSSGAKSSTGSAVSGGFGLGGIPDGSAAPGAAQRTPWYGRASRRGNGLDPAVESGLRARGFSATQARGIAAGVHAESRSNPNIRNASSGAFGIGQWLGARKAELFRRYGPNPSLSQQLDFLAWELRGGDHGGRKVLAQTTETGVLDSYIRDFMRPAAGAETYGDMRRGRLALAGTSTSSSSPTAPRSPTSGKIAPFYVDANGHWRHRDEGTSTSSSSPTPAAGSPAATSSTPSAAGDTFTLAASTLLTAAQTLLTAANAMRSTYDRGLNVGAGAAYSQRIVSNDNSQRIESSSHIGQVNIHGSNASQIWRGLEPIIRTRGLAFNAASGLSQ